MKKITLLVFMICFAITGAIAQENITLSRFQGEKITGIEIHGAFKVIAKQGESTGASVNIPARLEQELVFTLKNGILTIGFDGKFKGKNKETFAAEVTFSTLENVEISGACSLRLKGEITTNHLVAEIRGASSMTSTAPLRVTQKASIALTGASKMSGELTAPAVAFEISGTSKLTLKGKSTTANVEVSGASSANLANFTVDKATLEATGTSHINIHVVQELSAEAIGVSSITYFGAPQIIKLNTAGMSKIKKNN